jgi:hypothetical protein
MFDLSPRPNRKEGLSLTDYCNAAAYLGVPLSAIRAVDAVESAGSGYLPSGRPKILFEGHIFHRLTKGKYDKTNPTISYPTWTKQFYKGGEAEYTRLEEAIKLDEDAALKSASWGRFQILGQNFKAAACSNVSNFVERCFQSEGFQIQEFTDYIERESLGGYLKHGEFASFARHYNGPEYQRNHYDTKLTNANAKFAKIKADCRALTTPARIEEVYPADCREGCTGMDNSSLDDRYLTASYSPPTSTVPAPASVTGTPESAPELTNSQSPTVTSAINSEGGVLVVKNSTSLSESFTKTVGKISGVEDKVDSVNQVVNRFDSLKSVVKFLLISIKQIFVFIFCFVAGIPLEYWAVIAIVTLAAVLAYTYRKQLIGYFRKS